MLDEEKDLAELHASGGGTIAKARQLRAESSTLRWKFRSTLAELQHNINQAQVTIASSRANIEPLALGKPDQLSSGASNEVLQTLKFLGRSECDLDQIADDMIAAYKTAESIGDYELQELLAKALKQIGRYIAVKIGPKAAGVVIN